MNTSTFVTDADLERWGQDYVLAMARRGQKTVNQDHLVNYVMLRQRIAIMDSIRELIEHGAIDIETWNEKTDEIVYVHHYSYEEVEALCREETPKEA